MTMNDGVRNHTVISQGERITISARTRLWTDDVIVFMHGFGCSKELFADAFEAEALRHYSLCSFDFPSHGASQVVDPGAATLERYADVARALIEVLAPRRVAMVCHSMGGAVGLIAAQALGNCESFISVEGNLIREDCGIVSGNTAKQPRSEFVENGHAAFVKTLRSSGDRSLQRWADCYQLADSASLHAIAESLVSWSVSGKLLNYFAQTKKPHYIYGEQSDLDYLTPRLGKIPRMGIPDAGHFLMLDNPMAFYAAIADVMVSLRWRGRDVARQRRS
jgi:pimeloyl-ACP methyl ester carboxylesterase